MQRPVEFLTQHFPGLDLAPPLFYCWPFSLRFVLNATPDLPVFGSDGAIEMSVLPRALALFNAAFSADDQAIFCADINGDALAGLRSWKKGPGVFVGSTRRAIGLTRPAGKFILRDHDEDAQLRLYRWTAMRPRSINRYALFSILANDRYNTARPFTDDRVYLLNPTRRLIFHMYDDCGLDLIASDRESLRSIYAKHTGWLLNYDRERMKRVFID